LTASATTSLGRIFGRLPADALVEKADDEPVELEVVVGDSKPVWLDVALLQSEANPSAPQLFVALKQLDFVLADETRDLFGGNAFGRSLLHHSAGLIDQPVRFSDVGRGLAVLPLWCRLSAANG
jgi:hypothetical protein